MDTAGKQWFSLGRSSKNTLIFLGTAIAAGVLLTILYQPSFSGGFYLDSKSYVEDSHFFQEGASLGEAVGRVFTQGYHPAGRRILPNLTMALQTWSRGPDPGELRRVSVLIHTINIALAAFLLYTLVRMLRPDWSRKPASLCAAAAAGTWGLNPYHVETVAYVVQRSVLIQSAFFLTAFILFLKVIQADSRGITPLYYWLAIFGTLAAASLSKENALLFPVTAGAIYLYLPRSGVQGRERAATLAFLGIAGVLMLAVMFGVRGMDGSVGAGFAGKPFGPLERLMTESRVVLHQLILFLLPIPGKITLTPHYPISRGLFSPPSTLFSLLVLALMLAGSFRFRKNAPVWGIALIWFLTGHLMESTIFPLEIAFPHRNYLPTALIYLPVMMFGTGYCLQRGRKAAVQAVTGVLVIWVLFAALTFSRSSVWGHEETFWTKSIESSPGAVMPYLSLSAFYLEKGETDQALEVVDRALENVDFTVEHPRRKASILVNKGIALADKGKTNDGIRWIREGLDLYPNEVSTRYNLGVLLVRAGRRDEAEREFRSIIRADSTYPDAHLQLAMIMESAGRYPAALSLLDRELQLFPNNSYARMIRSRVLQRTKSSR